MTDQRPSVLYIDYSYGFGGAIKSLGLTLRAVRAEEHVLTAQPAALVRTFMPQCRVGSMRGIVNYHASQRVRTRFAASRIPGLRWFVGKLVAAADVGAAGANALRLIRLIRRRQVDLIHLNNGFLPLEAFLAARATGTPVIVHLRDFPPRRLPLSRAHLGSVVTVIAISEAVGAALRAATPVPLDVVTIHDPVDADRIAAAGAARDEVRQRLGLRPDDVAIGIFGRVIPWKGQREFVEAALIAMRDDRRIRAVVIGDGSDGGSGYYEGVKEHAARSGFGDRFVFAGFRADVEEHYAAMDIVVHASVTPEPFGMVVPEAMAAGRAVIASAAGGPLEVIEPGVTGLLTPPRDVAALAAAMLRLARDPEERARMGAAARAAVAGRLGLVANGARIDSVYRTVLSRRRGDTDSAAGVVAITKKPQLMIEP